MESHEEHIKRYGRETLQGLQILRSMIPELLPKPIH